MQQALSIFQDDRDKILMRLRANLIGGMEFSRQLSHLTDTRLRAMAEIFLDNDIAVIALGGYGRQELCPCSDIDIMFLIPPGASPEINLKIEKFLYHLWDSGTKVGHCTRTVKDCVRLAGCDMAVLTSLLDSRLLYGSEIQLSALQKALAKYCNKRRKNKYVHDKLAEGEQRHRRFGDSRYVLEPNIKEGKGGLRDYQSLFWIADVLYDARTPQDLVAHSILTEKEAKRFAKAHDFLLTVRCHLHDIAGRPEERLHFDIQPAIARRLGYRERGTGKAVERFMKHYFLVTRDIGDLGRIVCASIEARENAMREKPKNKSGFLFHNGRLDFPGHLNLENNPVEIIGIFHAAQKAGTDIHPFALRRITRKLNLIGDSFRNDRTANELFMEILTSRNDTARILRRMNEAGVLAKFIPAFGRIIALMQFDRYHVFTVDEHTIRAIDTLNKIENGDLCGEAPAACKAMIDIQNRRALFTALFLHDICKGRGGNHSLLGAELALALCPRLGLDDKETRLVSWLVFDHLLMSDVAFKRDLEDPKTIEDFAFRVYDPERLRLLLVLTTADIIAVGPGRWNAWKSKLLEDLFNKSLAMLSGAETVSPEKPDLPLPQDFIRGQTLIEFAPSPGHEATLVTIYTSDRPGLFATLAGGLSSAGANIIEARISTREDGTVVDTFMIQNASGKPFDKIWRQKQVKDSIIGTLHGVLDVEACIARHFRNAHGKDGIFDVPVRVRINNRASRTDTVIEVTARDRPGLLYSLTCTLRDHGLTIHSAKITTHGIRAVDVFYVQLNSGGKITDEEMREKLRYGLIKSISSNDLLNE